MIPAVFCPRLWLTSPPEKSSRGQLWVERVSYLHIWMNLFICSSLETKNMELKMCLKHSWCMFRGREREKRNPLNIPPTYNFYQFSLLFLSSSRVCSKKSSPDNHEKHESFLVCLVRRLFLLEFLKFAVGFWGMRWVFGMKEFSTQGKIFLNEARGEKGLKLGWKTRSRDGEYKPGSQDTTEMCWNQDEDFIKAIPSLVTLLQGVLIKGWKSSTR